MAHHLYGTTGTASSGKTTLLNHLRERGHTIIPEAATTIIAREHERAAAGLIAEHEMIHPRWRWHDFQREAADTTWEDTHRVLSSASGNVFADRPLADIVGFYRLAGERLPEGMLERVHAIMPRRVFLLERLPLRDNGIRYENAEQQALQDVALREAYEWLGADIVEVPAPWKGSVARSVAWRADYVLERLVADTDQEVERLYLADHGELSRRLGAYAVRASDDIVERTQLYLLDGRKPRPGERLRYREPEGMLTYKTPAQGGTRWREEVTLASGEMATAMARGLVPHIAYENRTVEYRAVGDPDIRLHLDSVAGLGEFIEIEGRSAEHIAAWERRLGLGAPLPHGYAEMLRG